MAEDSLDAFLELTSDSATMSVRVGGETLDSRRGAADENNPRGIQIMSFTFGNANAIAIAEKRREEAETKAAAAKKAREKRAAGARGSSNQAESSAPESPPAGKKKGKVDSDYRFQITKQLEASSPHLMTAYFSNSNKDKRKQHNNFSQARVTFRKLGADSRPRSYLIVTFGQVSVAGYKLETQGSEPPTETVDFSFLTCEMKYKPQLADGTMGTPVIKAWDFRMHKDKPVS